MQLDRAVSSGQTTTATYMQFSVATVLLIRQLTLDALDMDVR